MSRFLAILTGLMIFIYKAESQIIKSPLSLVGLPLTDSLLEAQRNYIDVPRTYFNGPRTYFDDPRAYLDMPKPYFDMPIEAVRNYINLPRNVEGPNCLPQPIGEVNKVLPVNIPNLPGIPSTTLITDCTPSICKHLADTINLLVVSNLLQNTIGGEEMTMQLAGPLLKNAMNRQNFVGSPINNLANANFGQYAPNLIASNAVAPSFVAPNFVAPNFGAPNFGAPNFGAPNFVASNIPGPKYAPQNMIVPNILPPNVYAPSPIAPPNTIASTPINNGALLSSLLNILSGAPF